MAPAVTDPATGGRELVDRARRERLAGIQLSRGEARLVGRVRVVLGLEREPGALTVRVAARPDQIAFEEVPGVELHAGLGRVRREHATAVRILGDRGELRDGAVRHVAVEHPVVVVAVRQDQLVALGRAGVADVLADRLQPAEIERRARYRHDLPGRDQSSRRSA